MAHNKEQTCSGMFANAYVLLSADKTSLIVQDRKGIRRKVRFLICIMHR